MLFINIEVKSFNQTKTKFSWSNISQKSQIFPFPKIVIQNLSIQLTCPTLSNLYHLLFMMNLLKLDIVTLIMIHLLLRQNLKNYQN
ncbi:hypothetical protein pb186bvf_000853 [Paramecium bursaria]